jgi:hypothetical protein
MKNVPGVKFGTTLKNKWGKNEITQYYTPVAGEWSNMTSLPIHDSSHESEYKKSYDKKSTRVDSPF